MTSPATPSTASLKASGKAMRPKLLLVDDQPINIQVLHQIFSKDCQIFMALDGLQALQLCHQHQPDLVLLDVVMPGMDGLEVCRKLKADAQTRHIPVIFVTGNNSTEQETEGLEAGAVDFIPKPFNPRVVRARVDTHLTLKRQSDLLRSLAYVDGLTGVSNRRRFDEYLEIEWRRSLRTGQPLTLILLDVDHFKAYNDLYGHQGGDECLRQIGGCLLDALQRPADLVSRYGGEEFACVLPETPWPDALHLGTQLGEKIKALGIAHQASSTAPCVTVSLGVAVRTADSQGNLSELLGLADNKLYEAKHEGRACCRGGVLA